MKETGCNWKHIKTYVTRIAKTLIPIFVLLKYKAKNMNHQQQYLAILPLKILASNTSLFKSKSHINSTRNAPEELLTRIKIAIINARKRNLKIKLSM